MSRVMDRLCFIEPQLPTLAEHPPQGSRWIHEVKHDGYRVQLVIERGNARLYTRNGYDWSDKFPGIVTTAATLRCRSAIIDGEAIIQDARGVSDFEGLRSAIRWQPHRPILYAFDLLCLDGQDIRFHALSERREALAELLTGAGLKLQFSEAFYGDGSNL